MRRLLMIFAVLPRRRIMKVAEGVPKNNVPPQYQAPSDVGGVLSKAASGRQKTNKRRGAGLPDEEASAEEDDDEDDIGVRRQSTSCRFYIYWPLVE
jgi:hypothetical protein